MGKDVIGTEEVREVPASDWTDGKDDGGIDVACSACADEDRSTASNEGSEDEGEDDEVVDDKGTDEEADEDAIDEGVVWSDDGGSGDAKTGGDGNWDDGTAKGVGCPTGTGDASTVGATPVVSPAKDSFFPVCLV